MSFRLMELALVGGAGWYAWKQGWLDRFIPSGEYEGDTTPAPTVTPASFGFETAPDPVLTKEEQLLRDNWEHVAPYARRNVELTASIMWQESRGNANALGPVIQAGANAGDRAHGLMQIMPITARDMYQRLGFQDMEPTSANLRTAAGSIYFGTAYIESLSRHRNAGNLEWFIRSYNGGPGHVNLTEGSAAKRENDGYYQAVLGQYLKLTNERMA